MKEWKNVPDEYISTEKETAEEFSRSALPVLIKTLLLCVTAAGFGMYTAVVYEIPVSPVTAGICCAVFAALWFAAILLTKKFFIPILAVITAGVCASGIIPVIYFGYFADHMLIKLDSRLLYTARYAAFSTDFLRENHAARVGIVTVFLLLCAVVCLIFAVGVHGRGVGVCLITTIILVVPAFAAEIIVWGGGIPLLIAGMVGLYCMWSSAAYLNGAGASDGENAPKILNTRFWQPGIAGAFLAAFAAFCAVKIFPMETSFGYNHILDKLLELQGDVMSDVSEKLSRNFGDLDGKGYFSELSEPKARPSGSLTDGNVTGLSVTPPSFSKRPILRVTSESDYPLLLKGDMGIDYLGGVWSVRSSGPDYERLLLSVRDYYPESTYPVYYEMLDDIGYDRDSVIGLSKVTVNYLVNTRLVLIPTSPATLNFKEQPGVVWQRDTLLRLKEGYMGQYDCLTYYPKVLRSTALFEAANTAVNRSVADVTLKKIGFKPTSDETFEEYAAKKASYEIAISGVYTAVPAELVPLMQKLSENVGTSDTDSGFAKIRKANDYFKNNYFYSLEDINGVTTADDDTARLEKFLFETRTGHCALYATSLTLLARYYGLPARYVSGYAVSEFKPDGDGNSGALYTATVLESDAHAWVEVYVDNNIGWVPFDPTPPADRIAPAVGDTAASMFTTEPPVSTTEPSVPETEPPQEVTAPPALESVSKPSARVNTQKNIAGIVVIVVISGTIVFTAIKILQIRRRIYRHDAEIRRLRRHGNDENCGRLWRMLLALLGMSDSDYPALAPRYGETPLEFARRADISGELSDIVRVFEKNEFGQDSVADGISESEYARAYEYVTEIYDAKILKQPPLVRIKRKLELRIN